jgi:hypothetical protein
VTEAGNRGNHRAVRLVEVGLPNERLRAGLWLVDTPGVGGVNVEHTAVTYAFLPNADAVLFVCDAVEPLSDKELDFLGDVAGHCETILVAVTKIDIAAEPDALLAAARERAAERLGKAPDDVVVVPVSSARRLDGALENDPELVELSNVPTLERELWDGIGRRAGAVQLAGALATLRRTVDRVRATVAVELAATGESSAEKLAELRARLDELRTRNDELKRNRASWRARLDEGLDKARVEAIDALADEIDLVEHKVEAEYLASAALVGAPAELLRNIARDLSLAVAESCKRFDTVTAELLAELAEVTTIDLGDVPGVAPPALDVPMEIDIPAPPPGANRSTTRKLLAAGRGAMSGTDPGGVIGGIIGAVLAGVVTGGLAAPAGAALGYAIGQIIGGVSGMREQMETLKEQEAKERRKSISTALRPVIRKQRRDARRALDAAAKEARTQLTEELAARIDLEGKALADMLRSVDEAGKLTATEAETRTAELSARLERLDTLTRRAHELRAAVPDGN